MVPPVPDSHGHDIKLNSSTTNVALALTIILQNLTTSSDRKKWSEQGRIQTDATDANASVRIF